MTKQSIWLPIGIALALGAVGCGDDSGGGGSSGNGGTPAGGDACSAVCNSPCTGIVPGTPEGDIEECVNQCEQSGILEGCDSETAALFRCVEAQDCDENASCTSETIAFAQCFDISGF